MKLTERLNSLNSVDDPHVSEEGMRLLEVGRSRGIKDLRVYNAVFQVRGPRKNWHTHASYLVVESGNSVGTQYRTGVPIWEIGLPNAPVYEIEGKHRERKGEGGGGQFSCCTAPD